MQDDVRELSALIHNVKTRICADKLNVFRINICLIRQAEGNDPAGNIPQRLHGVRVLGVGDDASVLRSAQRELAEGVLHVGQILKEVQMVGLNVEDDGDGRVEGQEGGIILAGFHDYRVAAANAVPRVQKRQRTAYHNGRVTVGSHKDMGAHGGRRCLAVGAGDAQSVAVALGYCAPSLRPLEYGDAQLMRADYLRIVIMNGGRAHDEFDVVGDVRSVMPDVDMDAVGAQGHDVRVLVHIRTHNADAHALEHLGQRRHRDAAYADKMPLSAGG